MNVHFLSCNVSSSSIVIYTILYSRILLNVLKEKKKKKQTAAALREEGILCEKEQNILYIYINI